jgi:hypothetical protein
VINQPRHGQEQRWSCADGASADQLRVVMGEVLCTTVAGVLLGDAAAQTGLRIESSSNSPPENERLRRAGSDR